MVPMFSRRSILNLQVIQHWTEDDCELRIGKDVERSDCVLFRGNIPAFAWRQ
jgi:hypothetical protein